MFNGTGYYYVTNLDGAVFTIPEGNLCTLNDALQLEADLSPLYGSDCPVGPAWPPNSTMFRPANATESYLALTTPKGQIIVGAMLTKISTDKDAQGNIIRHGAGRWRLDPDAGPVYDKLPPPPPPPPAPGLQPTGLFGTLFADPTKPQVAPGASLNDRLSAFLTAQGFPGGK